MKLLLCKLVRAVFLLILCAPAFCAPAASPYNQEFDQLRAAWGSADDLHRLLFLDRIFQLRDYVDDPHLVQSVFNEIQQALPADETLVRSETEAYLNQIAILEGRPGSGIPRHWYEIEATRAHVLTQARNAARGAENLALLAELEHLAGLPQAADDMQQAARLSPAAPHWTRAAAWIEDPLKKFSALQSALAVEPEDASARLQLAVYYIGRQQLEKAQVLLRAAEASMPGDFVVGEHLARLYIHLGLRSTALAQIREVEKKHPSPLWLQARLAADYEQIGLLNDAARLAASVLRYKATDRDPIELLARFHEQRHMTAELQSDYATLLRLNPDQAAIWSKLAQLQLGAGDPAKSRDSWKRVIELEPGNAEAYRQLAQAYGMLGEFQDKQQALTAYSNLLRKEKTQSGEEQDSNLLGDAAKLAAECFRHPPQEDDLALADIRVQELYSNGLTRIHVQQVFYIGSQSGANVHRTETIRYSPASQAVRVLHSRIWKRDGSVLDAEEDGDAPVGDSAISTYYDMRSRRLRFAGLEKGDVAELEYALSPTLSQSPYDGYFGELVTLAGHTPARLKRYALIFPQTQPMYVHEEKVPHPATMEENGRRIWVWDLHDVKELPREQRSPGVTELSPYVHVSTMADWQRLGSWYANLIRPQFLLDESLRKELERITQGKDSGMEKIAAIQEFVLRNTRYVALEFGVYSYKPYSVTQTYARRFGDCKDKASLMIALLRAAGIEAEIALVRTRSLGSVASAPASMAVFDHAIAYVPEYSLWLDGTAEYAGRELPLEDQGALALTVNLDGRAELRQVPLSTAADNYTKRIIHAQLTRQGNVQFHGSTVTRGEGAPLLRQEMAVPEQQLGLFQQKLAEIFPAVHVDSVAVQGENDLGSIVSVEFAGALNASEHKPVVALSSSWMPRNYAASFAATSSRAHDLVLSAPWMTEEEIHVALPSGAVLQRMPADEEIRSAFGFLRLHYSRSAHEIVIRSRVEFEKTRISVEQYTEFRQFCSAIERSFHNQITVGLAK